MNRKRKLKMYRVWMQGIFEKPRSGGPVVVPGEGKAVPGEAEKRDDAPVDPSSAQNEVTAS